MKIIAEVGSNWKTLDDCLSAIKIAKYCLADAVKFQLFSHKELYGVDGEMAGEMPRNWIPQLKESCDYYNIEFMCTAFSPDGYRFIDPFVKTHKIASAEITDTAILDTVRSFKKEVILSTGGASRGQILRALNTINSMLNEKVPICVMYCVTDYPARIVDLSTLTEFRDWLKPFNVSFGYSDHSIDVLEIPYKAYKMIEAYSPGGGWLEKHVNFAGYKDTPDAPHGLLPYEFELMVKKIKLRDGFFSHKINPCGWQRIKKEDGWFRPK